MVYNVIYSIFVGMNENDITDGDEQPFNPDDLPMDDILIKYNDINIMLDSLEKVITLINTGLCGILDGHSVSVSITSSTLVYTIYCGGNATVLNSTPLRNILDTDIDTMINNITYAINENDYVKKVKLQKFLVDEKN